ncbi:MAG: HAMP domain-containing protein [Desulfuromonadales bacterium]|nr:HAMP domain-containing protein [Desulfuromonadales bacterium]MBN2792143.1 HAMP domain-containing protein [Desulfuromonadales bacterium]
MKIRNKFIIPITVLVVIAALLVIFFSNRTVHNLVASNETQFSEFTMTTLENQAAKRQATLTSSIDSIGQRALEMAAVFSRIPDVRTAYRLALLGNLDDENDHEMQMAREHLRKVMAPYIEGYKSYTGNSQLQIHYHTPNGRSLVRLWRDGWQAMRNGKKVDVSDDLTSFRQTVIDINDPSGGHKPLSGIEVGRGGFAIRGLAPIVADNGEHSGSVEVLLSFDDAIAMNVNDEGGYEIAAYMIAEKLSTATKLQDPQKNPLLDNKYVFVSSSKKSVTNPVITAQMLDAGRNQHHTEIVGNAFVSTAPIYDYSGKVNGVMAVVFDLTKINSVRTAMEKAGLGAISAANWKFGGGAAVVVVIIIAFLIFVTQKVTGPLQKVVRVAQKIALGDLTESVDHRGTDEVGELSSAINTMVESLKKKADEAHQIAQGNLQLQVAVASDNDVMGQAFKSMVENLNEVLGEVQRAADQIDSGSVQVSDTAQTLSQGATESAASLEEISSSMNEIGSQTQQSADNAGQANQLANGAQSAARTGSERMGEMVNAMSEINEAGQSINKIIKVIDEIAFQTNLLALNAAVEAARAGQHGKGFAVVAEEVRNLAARSAKAAEETAQLIEGSVAKAENGTQIAEKTAEALGEIVESITKVTDLVGEIAAASNEQAQGIAQINQGLGQIDAAVQQSTATAEESAASAEELSSQSAHLKHMLSRFRLAGGHQNYSHSSAALSAPQPAMPAAQAATSSDWSSLSQQSAKPEIKLDDEEFGKF